MDSMDLLCPTCQPALTACTRPWQRWSRSSGCRSSGPHRGPLCCPPSAAPGWTEAGWRAGSGPAPGPPGWARSSAPAPGPPPPRAGPAGWWWSKRTAARRRRWSGCVPTNWCTQSPWGGGEGGVETKKEFIKKLYCSGAIKGHFHTNTCVFKWNSSTVLDFLLPSIRDSSQGSISLSASTEI